jgi:hypothetical protein
MSNVRPIIPDAYSQRYHALSIAATLNLDYKKPRGRDRGGQEAGTISQLETKVTDLKAANHDACRTRLPRWKALSMMLT